MDVKYVCILCCIWDMQVVFAVGLHRPYIGSLNGCYIGCVAGFMLTSYDILYIIYVFYRVP